MAGHHEGFADDVGGKLLLLSGLIAIFGVASLILMPLGAAFAPPPTPPAATAAAAPAAADAPATGAEATQPTTDTTAMSAEATAPAAAPSEGAAAATAPQGPPPFIAALIPGIVMLIVAIILGAVAGVFLGFATARAEEEAAMPTPTPH